MNTKKPVRFFNLHHDGGFTLVELIVVIAILAILAAVAVPAYSGYIEKAERAADEALLAEVNKAFAAACMSAGENNFYRTDVPGQVLTDGFLTYEGPHEDLFENYYEGGEFKVFTALIYNELLGAFEGGKSFGNGYTVSEKDLNKILGSTWAKELTADQILNLVSGTVDDVQQVYGNYFDDMVDDPKFKEAAAKALGVENYDKYIEDMIIAAYEKENGVGSWATQLDFVQDEYINGKGKELKEEINSNMAIVVAAQNTGAQADTVMNLLTANDGAGAKESIKATLTTGDSTVGLSQATIAYGLYHSYIYSRDDLTEEEKQELSTPMKALNGFEDNKFQEYLETEQATTDLEGLLAAMNVISGQGTEAVGNVASSGVENEELLAALKQMLGN